MRHGGALGTAMTDRRFDDSPRGQLAEAFQALSEAAVRAGWGEGDVTTQLPNRKRCACHDLCDSFPRHSTNESESTPRSLP